MARKPPPPPKTAFEALGRATKNRQPKEPTGGFSVDVGAPPADQSWSPDDTPMMDFGSALYGEARAMTPGDDEHDSNLAETIDPRELMRCAADLFEAIDRDIEGRKPLDELIAKAIRNLGFDRKSDTRSDYMEGGSGIIHPMLAMAAVDFQARAMREIFPAAGPVKTEIVGDDSNPELRAKAERVKKLMNYQVTTECKEWRPSVDEMLMRLPIAGTAISKVTWDYIRGRPRRENVGALDFICPIGTDSLERAPRYTHRMRYWDAEVQEMMGDGVWRSVPLTAATDDEETTAVRDAERKVIGEDPTTAIDARDARREIFEAHVEWRFDSLDEADPEPDGDAVEEEPGADDPDTDATGTDYQSVGLSTSGVDNEFDVPDVDEGDGVIFAGGDTDQNPMVGKAKRGALPYVITLDKQSRQILAVRRNWKKDDDKRQKVISFVTRAMFPWNGIFGIGLFHLIGGLNTAATGALRALLDSAMVNNMPGGLRLRGGKTTAGRVQVVPMTFAEIDGPPGETDIRKVAMPLPFNPPSPVLFQVMEYIVQAGMAFASVATQDLPTNAAQMAVGTMMAMIEEKGAVYSGVHERLHYAQADELKLLSDLDGTHLEDTKTYRDFGGDMIAYRADFDGTVDVLPVSDPTIFSQLQRSAKAQATLQLAQSAKADGVTVDMRAAYLNVAQTLNIQNFDSIFPEPEQAQPLDPVSEVAALLMGSPVQAFPGQAHQAHLDFLRATMADPQYAPLMTALMPKVQALAASHASLMRREEIEQAIGQPLPQPGQALPPQIAMMIAQASAQAAQQIAQARPPIDGGAADQGQDVMSQAALITAQAQDKLAEAEIMKAQTGAKKVEVDAQIRQLEIEAERENIDADLAARLKIIAAQLQAKLTEGNLKVASTERIASAKIAVDIGKERNKAANPPPAMNGFNGGEG